jgi:hypothetical protein
MSGPMMISVDNKSGLMIPTAIWIDLTQTCKLSWSPTLLMQLQHLNISQKINKNYTMDINKNGMQSDHTLMVSKKC